MTPVFNTADRSTWPEVLTLEQIAELFGRTPKAIRQAMSRGRFSPSAMPGKPLRWSKTSVVRYLGQPTRESLEAR